MQQLIHATDIVDLQTDACGIDIVAWHRDRRQLCSAQLDEKKDKFDHHAVSVKQKKFSPRNSFDDSVQP